MNNYRDPGGVDFTPIVTTAPAGAANAVGQNGQFGVNDNQVRTDGSGVPDLATKAQLDLAGKVEVQRRG